MPNISAVILTWNEEKNLRRCISTLSTWVDEIVVVDTESTDATAKLAQSLGARVFSHSYIGYADPARNFALNKAVGEWIIMIDADEEVPPTLGKKILNVIQSNPKETFFRLPRKNISFGKWLEHGMWWPDYQIRLFRKGYVEWKNDVHSMPFTKGTGSDFPAKEEYALIHHNYQTISQFVERLNRYTTFQAKEKIEENSTFHWMIVLKAPFQEFLRRFFLAEGYKDGLHGLCLSLMQAFSECILYLKIWELKSFPEVSAKEIKKEMPHMVNQSRKEMYHWLSKTGFINKLTARLHTFLS